MSHLEADVIEAAASGAPSGEAASHLQSCAECRAQVKSAKGRQRLLRGLTPYTLSEHGFKRVEAKLEEAVREGLPSATPWWRWLGVGAALVAAALAVTFALRPQVDETGPVAIPIPKVALAKATFRPLTVLRATKAQVRSGEAWRALSVGDVVGAGEAVSAESVTLADAAPGEWAFVASGSLSLGGVATLTLGAGSVTANVHSSGEQVDVLASTREVLASSALFQVTRVGAEMTLLVREGSVEVLDSVSGERRKVSAPASLRWSDGSALSASKSDVVGELAAPVIPARPWVPFDASDLAVGTTVLLDGASIGDAPFVELVSAGRHRLTLSANGGVTESWIDLVGGQRFTAHVTEPVAKPEGDGLEPDAAALARVTSELRSQKPKLAACYDKWLKANPSAQGEVTMQLLVSAKGKVKRAKLLEQGVVSASSAECLVTTAKSLVLSPLGVETTLELPLVLHPRGK